MFQSRTELSKSLPYVEQHTCQLNNMVPRPGHQILLRGKMYWTSFGVVPVWFHPSEFTCIMEGANSDLPRKWYVDIQ